MKTNEKYCGIIPAFYACYDDSGQVSADRVKKLTRYFIEKGVKREYEKESNLWFSAVVSGAVSFF